MSSLSKFSRVKCSLLFSGLINFRFLLLLLFSDSSLVTLDAEQVTLDAELILLLLSADAVVTCSTFLFESENGKMWDLLIKF